MKKRNHIVSSLVYTFVLALSFQISAEAISQTEKSNTDNNDSAVKWTEFSFILKPSSLEGVGVFATHDIPSGTKILTQDINVRTLKIKDIPAELLKYCIYSNEEECICPERFDRMEIGWYYLNHSVNPNIAKESITPAALIEGKATHSISCYAIKDIKTGDEILINYNDLNEPEHLKENFYK